MERLEVVWDGDYIGAKTDGNYLIKLHFVDFFYVEEYFDIEKDVRVKFVGLETVEAMDVYWRVLSKQDI